MIRNTSRFGLLACVGGLALLGCDRSMSNLLPMDDGLGARAVELRERIVEQAEVVCSTLGPSSPMLSVAKTRVYLSEQGLSCLDLTTPAKRLGPLINPRSREETVSPMAEWMTILGAPAVPKLRRALTDPNAEEGRRHLAVWALARIVSERMPYPHGTDEARCLLKQWQEESGAPLPGQATLLGFEPWPVGPSPSRESDGIFGPDPRLPAPFNEARADAHSPDETVARELSTALGELRADRRALLEEALGSLRALQGRSVDASAEAQERELGQALAVIAVVRPEIQTLLEELRPWLETASPVPYEKDPVMAVLEAYGVEILPLIKHRLSSEDPELRGKLRRLLRKIAGESGTDCLLRSWARSLSADDAERLLALRDPSGAAS